MNLVYYCMYLYLLLKPYYIFKSGSIQVSDIFLLISYFFLLFYNKRKFILRNKMFDNRYFIFFVVISSFINIFYFILEPDKRYILSILYFIFNCLSILIFSVLIENNIFLKKILAIFKFNLIVQFIICILNLGRYYQFTRYMGTFNDPNQFGYYILICYSFINLIELKIKNNNNKYLIIYLFLSLFLIYKSQSTGMFLGFAVLIILQLLQNIQKPFLFVRRNINKIVIIILLLIPLLLSIYLLKGDTIKSNIKNSNFLYRLTNKINKMEENDKQTNIFQDRALDYIILYPKYIIFGAGEGGELRFHKVHHYTEIHSTLPAMLFYYGIIPFLFLIKWIATKLSNINYNYLIIYIALIAESFTLANQRQALFWCIIVMAEILKKGREMA